MDILIEWYNKLKQFDESIELRNTNNIVGFCEDSGVSFNISISIDRKFVFRIQHKGHTLLHRSIDSKDSEKAFECYFILLSETIEFEKKQQKRIRKFPDFIKEDNRHNLIEKILQ